MFKKIIQMIMVAIFASNIAHAQVADKFAQATIQASQKSAVQNRNQISADSIFGNENFGNRQTGAGVYLQQHYSRYTQTQNQDTQATDK